MKIEIILNLLFKYQKIIKYIISGGSGAVVNIGVLYLLTDVFGYWYLFSSMISFFSSCWISFILQKFWTFKDVSVDKFSKQALMFFFVQTVNLGLNTMLVYLLVEFLGLWYIAAQIISGVLIAISSFIIFSKIIFSDK